MAESAVQSHAEIVVGSDEKKLIRVLHVDDELDLLKIAKQCLELQGPFQVDTAGSVEEAFNKLKEKEYDAVISDYQMPGKDGLEFLEMLRKNGNTIPFIMFTGKGREEVAIKSLNLGANQYLNKVGETETVYTELAHSITELVQIRRSEEKLRESEAARLDREKKLEAIFASSPDAITIFDLNGNVAELNEAAMTLHGFSEKGEILGKSSFDYVAPRDHSRAMELFGNTLREGSARKAEISLLTADGREFPAELYANVVRDACGMPTSLMVVTRDVSERKKAEEALRGSATALKKSEAEYRSLVEQSTQGIMIAQGPIPHIVFANSTISKILGYTVEELTLLSPQQTAGLVHPDDRELFFERFKDRLEGKQAQPQYDVRGIRKDGTMVWLELSSARIEHGGQPAVQAIFTDITERKKTEETLKESEERFRDLFESIQDPVGIFVGREGRLIDYNGAFKKSSGYTNEELKGKVFLDFVHPDDRAMVLEKYQTKYSEEELPLIYEIRGVNKRGESIPMELSVSAYKKKGRAIGIEVIHRDITERKRYEERLSALNIYSRDLNMAEKREEIYRLTLDAMQKVLGFEYADFFIIDKNMLYIVDQRGYPEPFPLELPLDGSKKGITIKVAKTGNSVIVQDVRKNTDFVEGLPGILSELAVPIKAGQEILGVLNVEDKRLNAFDEEDQELLEILASHAATAISNSEYAWNLEKYATEIRESQQKFERLFMDNPEAAIYLDVNFIVVNVNPRFCQLFGYSVEEVKGKKINKVVVPEDMREEAESLDRDAKNGYASHDTVRKRKDGSLVPVSISAAPVTFENNLLGYIGIYKDITELKRAQEESEESRKHFQMLFDLMADPVAVVDGRGKILEVTQKAEEITGFKKEELVGKNLLKVKMFGAKTKAVMIKKLAERMMGMNVQPYEVELLKKNGGKLIYEINAAKIDYKGKPADLVVFRDIMERKNLEEKLRVVGSLTRHDVRNKLCRVTGNAYLLKKKLAGNPEALEQLADMENAVRNVETIFEFARTYEKLGVEQLAYLSVSKAVGEAASLFSDLKGIRIANECGGLTVLADSLLRQLFYNLIDDSLKYGEKLTQIRVRYEEFEDKLKLIYEDDGVGISRDAKSKLFTEGFTTGKGSGYGLYMVSRVMDVYGWAIDETGVPGKGAQFTISIPKTKSDRRQNFRLS
ncbi:MAG: PAS domain S-box protein [Candidatus Bathyarchaeia archaeon]